MTLGIKPDHPAADYGYIAPGAPIEATGARRVRQFVEKPSADVAGRYIKDGTCGTAAASCSGPMR